MSPVVRSIGTELGTGWSRLLRRMPLEDEPFASVLREQVRFRVVPPGASSDSDVVADSAAARELLRSPATRRFTEGVLELYRDVSGPAAAKLAGFSLSTSEAGYLANRAVHHFGPGVRPTRAAYEAGIAASEAHIAGTVAVRRGGWMHLGPRRSEGLLHALQHPTRSLDDYPPRARESLGHGTKTILHELNHIGSRAGATWLSEGKAEVLARWPGRIPHAGRALGIEVPKGIGRQADDHGPYQGEVAAVRALLRMAGIDPRRSKDFRAAEQLLNATPPDELAGTIADLVARRHGTSTAERRQLRDTATRLVERDIAPDGRTARPGEVQRLARELERARRGDHGD